ncbi:hypothetical protein Acr_02g0009970 [Actinidia rufa]|uniref:Uncharacterized protein n=1 Tax=Actinidia rufa TaxID=165716 RepID=A0A7J0EAS4_9ERIC|nr:hypothetical protein Acr_02g0009970 [Actinidia rufa]
MLVDSSKDQYTSLALARTVMLPNDVIDLTTEGLKKFMTCWSCSRSSKLEKVTYRLVYEWMFNKRICQAGDNYDKHLAELRPSIYEEGYMAFFLKELGIFANHPAWSKVALEEPVDEDLEKSTKVGGNLGPNAAWTSMAIDGGLDANASFDV